MKTQDKLNKARELVKIVNDGLSREDFTNSFKSVVEYVKRMDKAFAESFKALSDTITKRFDALEIKLHARLSSIKDGKDGEDGRDGRDGIDGKTPVKGIHYFDGANGKDGSPDFADDIRNKLELLEGEDRLSIGAIHGLAEALEANKPRIADQTAIGVLRHQLGFYDLSSQLNGSTTRFNLPSFQAVVQVTLSSYPTILRPGIDFSTTNSPSQITFLGTIATNAASILGAGQTCIILMNQ